MPVAVSYPGVYIEEIPSGVHTITGVATSITAFVGRTERGPVSSATPVLSMSDYQQTFGGITSNAPVAYAVRDFFLNGGSQAIVVRLFAKDSPQVASATSGGLVLNANSPGEWATNYSFICDQVNPVQSKNNFNLSIYQNNPSDQANPILVERITSLSTDTTQARRADYVLAAQSQFVVVASGTMAAPTIYDPTKSLASQLQTFSGGDKNAALNTDGSRYGPFDGTGLANKTGIYALEQADLFNLLCIPPDTLTGDTLPTIYGSVVPYCVQRRAVLIVDPPKSWDNGAGKMDPGFKKDPRSTLTTAFTPPSSNAVIYFPRVIQDDPANSGQEATFAACGVIAGQIAATDTARGVWKAPAGIATGLFNVNSLSVNLTDGENGLLNPVGINCLRYFKAPGNIIWGARTLRGDDLLADDYKYLPVRRLALYIEESLYRGTQWAVFEPNDAPLWSELRLSIGSFMQDLFRQGAFQGSSASSAYLVKCDSETTTQTDIDNGVVNVLVGFAPLKPAEFVILQIQQLAGQTSS
jgi:phage tail sheath protein FI